jgi:hypothetical protein
VLLERAQAQNVEILSAYPERRSCIETIRHDTSPEKSEL